MTEQERILHNLNNYYKYCLYSSSFLLKRTNGEASRPTDNEDAFIFLRIATDLKAILSNDCLTCTEFTQEDVDKLWESNYGFELNPFIEIPIEYKKS